MATETLARGRSPDLVKQSEILILLGQTPFAQSPQTPLLSVEEDPKTRKVSRNSRGGENAASEVLEKSGEDKSFFLFLF